MQVSIVVSQYRKGWISMKYRNSWWACLVGLSLLFCGCRKETHAYSFSGDGKLKYLEKPGFWGADGWQLKFNEFSMSKDFCARYAFCGLPPVKKSDNYMVYLYAPATIKKSELEDAVLKIALSTNDVTVVEYEALLKNWDCMSYNAESNLVNRGDGLEKNYYSMKLSVPANLSAQYDLNVRYSPPVECSDVAGYVYLSIGGYK
ncbi:hypothetical protein [Pontiella sp.]|uniref:hypothetical protein n=1 Tax=Pontiella sp. TaxID=2837462 RepID=UPI0035658B50